MAQAPRIVSGAINADGTIASGSGFTVGSSPGGHFVISFTTPFSSTPVIVATGGTGSTHHAFVNYDALSTNGVNVYLHNDVGGLDAAALAFVAMAIA